MAVGEAYAPPDSQNSAAKHGEGVGGETTQGF